jgi:hypothetical protein
MLWEEGSVASQTDGRSSRRLNSCNKEMIKGGLARNEKAEKVDHAMRALKKYQAGSPRNLSFTFWS